MKYSKSDEKVRSSQLLVQGLSQKKTSCARSTNGSQNWPAYGISMVPLKWSPNEWEKENDWFKCWGNHHPVFNLHYIHRKSFIFYFFIFFMLYSLNLLKWHRLSLKNIDFYKNFCKLKWLTFIRWILAKRKIIRRILRKVMRKFWFLKEELILFFLKKKKKKNLI